MNSGSVRPESMWWLCFLEWPGFELSFVSFLKEWCHPQVKDGDLYVSGSKMGEGCLAVFKESGCYHIICPLRPCWPKLSLLAIAAIETKNCLYFSRQIN